MNRARRYATVHDLIKPESATDVCGGWRRQSHVTMSFSHELQVNFIGSLVDERIPNFLLQYQGDLRTGIFTCTYMYIPAYLPASCAELGVHSVPFVNVLMIRTLA